VAAAGLLAGCSTTTIPPDDNNACPAPAALAAPWKVSAPPSGVGHNVKTVGIGTYFVKQTSQEITKRLDLLAREHITEVRFDVPWYLIETSSCRYDWSDLDLAMRGLAEHNISALLLVAYAPSWETGDPACSRRAKNPHCAPGKPGHAGQNQGAADFGRFVGALWSRYKNFSPKLQLWNEAQRKIGPALYANMLREARKQARNAYLVYGADFPPQASNDPNRPDRYLAAVDQAGGKGTYDAVSVHPYTTPNLPRQGRSGNNGWGQMYLVRDYLVSQGGADIPIFITEIGSDQTPKQAPILRAAMNLLATPEHNYITALYWYALTDDPPSAFGIFTARKEPKPVAAVIADYNHPA